MTAALAIAALQQLHEVARKRGSLTLIGDSKSLRDALDWLELRQPVLKPKPILAHALSRVMRCLDFGDMSALQPGDIPLLITYAGTLA